MFYRIKENRLYDYADYKYKSDCLEINGLNTADYEKDKEKYIVKYGILTANPNYEQEKAEERQKYFEGEFFNTSLGYIRRKVTMKDGAQKEFLTDLLPSIKLGLELGENVKIIVYQKPDFTRELTTDYMVSLQEVKQVNTNFVKECLTQTMKDFGGV